MPGTIAKSIILSCLLSTLAYSSEYVISKDALEKHVAILSSPALEGRLTGSHGEKLSTDYIASYFRQSGLEPAGDKGTFFQYFDFTAGIVHGKNNVLRIRTPEGIRKSLVFGQDWIPLSYSQSTAFNNRQLIFAGYGIKTLEYNSWKNLEINKQWVLVFQGLPVNLPRELRRKIAPYASLRYKVFTAKAQGAKGIIFINDTQNTPIPFAFNPALSDAGIVVLSVSHRILNDLLKDNEDGCNSVKKLQMSIESGQGCILSPRIKINGQTDLKKNKQQGRNVLAKLRGSSDYGKMILVGAHADHLGRGQLGGSRAGQKSAGEIHPGADDNASGVAALLETAKKLAWQKKQGLLKLDKDILFAAWSGEEFGILGSSYFIKTYPRPLAIDALVNLDMIGHLRKYLLLQGTGSSPDWLNIIKTTCKLPFVTQSDPWLPTDSTAFYLQAIPVLNIFTGAHASYHHPADSAETLNYAGIKHISDFLVDLVLALEKTKQPLHYQAIKKIQRGERELKIWLGTIPDYASADISGVKLSAVAKNSPAEQAGLQENDIIIALNAQAIHDIYDYTFLLNSLVIGKPTPLTILRNKRKIHLIIRARQRE